MHGWVSRENDYMSLRARSGRVKRKVEGRDKEKEEETGGERGRHKRERENKG